MGKPRKVLEHSTGIIHYSAPHGMDQATICGITDWLTEPMPGTECDDAPTCMPCKEIAKYFGYKEKGTKP